MTKRNPHTGSGFDEFLKEEKLFEEVHAKALKRARQPLAFRRGVQEPCKRRADIGDDKHQK